ncbi:hypothetical protein [Roseinatronobacter alkalisoli]|uniref:Uncharacterized protein n=1 Tax=Roseinatronobacter alkalisoli TaxID=3028235 RepID=A0ABT5TE72_9RHOB|nr:hypothetical protein [Roseinatronobacter sp. HJB301]MDD7973404.1 hypothetical protein [Roseinatronobacter sp. HJB301]
MTQRNRFLQGILVQSAIIFSLAGVLLALVLRREAFSVVMSGTSIVALAGIVVNNSIMLIDALMEPARRVRRRQRQSFGSVKSGSVRRS